MTMEIDADSAVDGLGPERMGKLRGCLEGAWTIYDASIRPTLPLCSAVGMANILRELVIEQVRNTFVGVPGVEIKDNTVKGRFLLEIDKKFLLQFKKFTKDFQTVNNPTETSLAFDNQQIVEGVPDLPRITVGYQLGQYNTSLAGMWVAFCIGKENIWHVDLQGGERSLKLEFPPQDESAAKKERKADQKKKDAAKPKKRKRLNDDTDSDGAPPSA